MSVTPYIYDGGTLTAAATQQGTKVPNLTKRVIKSASLVNTSGAPISGTVNIVTADNTVIPHIFARPIAAGETYPCFELIGKGVNAGGAVQALGLGLVFMYTATDFV
jgi:hypothetical protein